MRYWINTFNNKRALHWNLSNSESKIKDQSKVPTKSIRKIQDNLVLHGNDGFKFLRLSTEDNKVEIKILSMASS